MSPLSTIAGRSTCTGRDRHDRRPGDRRAIRDGRRIIDEGFRGAYRSCGYDLVEAEVIQGSGRHSGAGFYGFPPSLSVPTAFSGRVVVREDAGSIVNALTDTFAQAFKGVAPVAFDDDPALEAAFEGRADDEVDASAC